MLIFQILGGRGVIFGVRCVLIHCWWHSWVDFFDFLGLMREKQEETIAVFAITIIKKSKPSWLFYPLEFHSSYTYTDTSSGWGCIT